MKFKVGDRVKLKSYPSAWGDAYTVGKVYKIEYIGVQHSLGNDDVLWLKPDFGKYSLYCGMCYVFPNEVKLIGGHMSKYDELEKRIEKWFDKARNLGGGWDKEVDDILNEITKDGMDFCIPHIDIPTRNPYQGDGIYIRSNNPKYENTFHYSTQCEKLEAFKKALMWLLDHSDIKRETALHTQLKTQVDGLERELNEVKNKLAQV